MYKHLLFVATGVLFLQTLASLNLFYFDPSEQGYAEYRQDGQLHSHCLTGILHSLFMPLAVSGFFLMIYAHEVKYSCINLTWLIYNTLAFWFSYHYFVHGTWAGTVSIIINAAVLNWCLYQAERFLCLRQEYGYSLQKEGFDFIMLIGGLLLFFSVAMMEFVGHWYLESNGSHVSHLINSVYHTLPYMLYAPYYVVAGLC